MKLLLWEIIHSDFLKVILLCLVANIWMYKQGWYKSDEYYMQFSLKGPNTGSFMPFIPKIFSLIFMYYIAALKLGGMMHETRYIALIICFFIYLGVTFGYFHAYKNKKSLYLMLFSGAFLISTVPHYILKFIGSSMDGSRGGTSYNSNAVKNNSVTNNFDLDISQQRENYFNNQADEQARQAEINANSMGYYSAQDAKTHGIDV